VREPLLLSHEKACDRAQKKEEEKERESRKHERSRSRLAFLKKRNPRIGQHAMPTICARATQTTAVRFRAFKRSDSAASFACCRFRSNSVGFASVPGRGLPRPPAAHPHGPRTQKGRGAMARLICLKGGSAERRYCVPHHLVRCFYACWQAASQLPRERTSAGRRSRGGYR
jgi:hypothetical protein